MVRNYSRWVEQEFPALMNKTIVTISMEGYVPELTDDTREANIKGGLGIYFGDKLEGLNSIGIDRSYGCMPMYRKRLVQTIVKGVQHIDYKNVSYDNQPVKEVIGNDDKPIAFDVWGIDPKNCMVEKRYHVKVYSIDRGGSVLYMFDCPEVFDVLYPDNVTHKGFGREQRFLQETIFGQCVHTLLRLLDLMPDVLHANEGHVAVAAAIIRGDKAFDKTAIVYTNHTVVPAGLEVYDVKQLVGADIARARYIMRFPDKSWQKLWRKFVDDSKGSKLIDFSKGAIGICNAANAVSAEHAEATSGLFPDYDAAIVPVLNGTGDTWVFDELVEMESQGQLPDAELLIELGKKAKQQAFDLINDRIKSVKDEYGRPVLDKDNSLDINKPTIWTVKRLVEYKSQFPVLKDIVHVICADRDKQVDSRWGKMNGLGMQLIIGGLAPQNSSEEDWIKEFVRWMQDPELKGRFTFVPGSDTNLLKMQAIGADICLNCPQPKQEACGTSDQRSARNGGINVATKSGGPVEYIKDGVSGMLVGPYNDNHQFYENAPKDILDKLSKLSEVYYKSLEGDDGWGKMKLQSYLSSSKVTALAMEKRYARVYLEAIESRQRVLLEKENVKKLLPESKCCKCGTGLIYEVVPRDYKSEDGRCGLSPITDDLEYIANCGVNYIYLVGVMKHTTRPFEVLDPFDLDQATGTFDELKKFLDKAHSLGIKVLLDWMANQHVAKESPLCNEHPEWFLYTDGADGNYYFDKGLRLVRGVDRDANDRSLKLASATDQVCIKSFPRRWTTLAQPDLSHSGLQEHGINVGKFWLEKGFDGFRIDAALATFPDQIKNNWGLEVRDNLSKTFVRQMRQVNPDCFIMFEGFERQGELLDLAGNFNCAAYNWKPRNFTTEALRAEDKSEHLIQYLRQVEEDQEDLLKFINLGPEHDAFDFGDPWARLSYAQSQILYLLYQFLPGYCLLFNGQLDGQPHNFKSLIEKTEPVPRPSDMNSVKNRAGRWLFNLRHTFGLIFNGQFKALDTDSKKVVAVARHNGNEILIAVVNPCVGAQEVKIDLRDIIDDQLLSDDFESSIYLQEVIQPINTGRGICRDVAENLPVSDLMDGHLYVAINAVSWQIIRLCLMVGFQSSQNDQSELIEDEISDVKDNSDTDFETSISQNEL